ncbi:PAS domain S-box protein [Candidatus Cloacimonadota bacterium]
MIKILILEDVLSDAKLIKRELKKSEIIFETQLVQNRLDFIKALDEYQPDLVLSDYSLPQFTGLEAIEIVREKNPKTPIIIVTGSTNEETAVTCMKRGAWDYVLKDRLSRLGHAVKNVMELKIDREEIQNSQIQLKESENNLRTLFNAMTDLVMEIDSDGRYVYVAPTSPELLYKPSAETIGKTLHELFPKSEADIFLELIRNSLEKDKILTIEYPLTINGRTIWFEGKASPKTENSILYMARDITESKRSEQIQSVLNHISNAVNITENLMDLYKIIHQELGSIIDTSNFYIALYNETTDEIYTPYFRKKNKAENTPHIFRNNGITNYIIKSAEPLFLTEELRKELIREGEVADYVWTSKTLLGVPLKIENKVVGCMVVRSSKEDSTFSEKDLSVMETVSSQVAIAIARKQAEESLRNSEEQFRTFAENVPGVVSIYDVLPDESYNFLYMGPGLEKIVGEEQAKKVYENPGLYFKMIPATDKEHLEREAVKAIKSNMMLDAEYRLEIEENVFIWIRSHFRVTVIKKATYRWQGLIFEITDKKLLENELIQNEQLLQKTQEMAHLGSWIYDPAAQEMYLSNEVRELIDFDPKTEKPGVSSILDRLFQEEREKVKKDFIHSIESKKAFELYHRLLTSNGEIRHVHTKVEHQYDKNDKPVKSIGMTQDISELVQAQEKEQEQIENIKLLSQSAMDFVDLPMEENIYQVIAQKINEFVGSRAYVIISSTSENKLTTKAVVGIGPFAEHLIKLLGTSPVGREVDIRKADLDYLKDGKIHVNEKNLYDLCLGSLPESVCISIEKMSNLGNIYTIGLVKEQKLLGSVVVITRQDSPEFTNLDFIETYVKQAAISVQKREAEKALLESEKLSTAVIEGSPIGISVRDKFGTLVMFNKAWRKIWDISDARIKRDLVPRKKLKMDNRDSYLGPHLKQIKKVYEHGGDYTIPEVKLSSGSAIKAKWIRQRFYAIKGTNNIVERVVILTSDISDSKQSEIFQSVLYNISHRVNTTSDLNELFEVTHKELNKIINTKNFFIALKDGDTDKLIIPYSRDEMDEGLPYINPDKKTLSSYVLKTGKPLLANEELMNELTEKGEIDAVGSLCKLWLGVPLKLANRTIGVIVVQSYVDPQLYTDKDLEVLIFVSNEIALAIDKKRIEEEVNVQKTYFENLFQVSPDALVILANDETIIQINQEFTDLFGYSPQEALGRKINELIVPIDLWDEGWQNTVAVAKGEKIHFESIRRNKNGDRIDIECIGKPIILGEDQLAVQAIYRDITVRKRHEEQIIKDLEEKEILLKEVHHRVKNNMQVISSMLKLQSRYVKDKDALELFKNSQNRVKSMALIHERIYKSPDLASVNFEDYVKSLVVSLFMNYGVNMNNVSFETNIAAIPVNMNQAIPLGLIINELISNALKHAFPNDRKGKLSITFSKNNDDKHELIIKDNGIGFIQDIDVDNPETLGMQLVYALTSQLQGTIDFMKARGTKVILTF